MALIECPECGRDVSDKSDKCPECGFPIYLKVNEGFKKIKCSYCGAVNDHYRFKCAGCGAVLEKEESGSGDSEKSSEESRAFYPLNASAVCEKKINKKTALLLCILFGYFGAHKFYEGRTKVGLVYLCTLGLFGIGWIADMIVIAGKTDPYYVYNCKRE